MIIKNNPDVTRVEEWTKAEIGVGAAMAIGSQGEKGKIALFVMKVITKKTTEIKGRISLKKIK